MAWAKDIAQSRSNIQIFDGSMSSQRSRAAWTSSHTEENIALDQVGNGRSSFELSRTPKKTHQAQKKRSKIITHLDYHRRRKQVAHK
jgi:hypothetical protein